MTIRLDEMNMKGIFSVLVHANVAQMRRRDNMRVVTDFTIKAIDVLARERTSMGDNFEQVAVHYFDLARNFHVVESDVDRLRLAFEQKLNMDVEEARKELSPLGQSPIIESGIRKKTKPGASSKSRNRRRTRQGFTVIDDTYDAATDEQQ